MTDDFRFEFQKKILELSVEEHATMSKLSLSPASEVPDYVGHMEDLATSRGRLSVINKMCDFDAEFTNAQKGKS